MGDRSNRLGNLITVCDKCDNSKNHQNGGKLWGLKSVTNKLPQAAFMNTVRWSMLEKIKDALPGIFLHLTYGAATKKMRRVLRIEKSHANDAYAMGSFHPKKRAQTTYWRKRRRNNRVLEKFFDAKYIDIRDGKEKSGKELSTDRTNRSQKRNSPGSLRSCRARYAVHRKRDGSISPRKDDRGRAIRDVDGRPIPKLKKGYRQIRHQRYPKRPGDTVIIDGRKQKVNGTHNKGTSLVLSDGKTTAISKFGQVIHAGGWERIIKKEEARLPLRGQPSEFPPRQIL